MRKGRWTGILCRGIMPLRLLLVDDNTHFLEAAPAELERGGISVVGLARTIDEALGLAEETRPDVTLVDVDLGQESGFDLARRLTTPAPGSGGAVILISAYPEEDLADLVACSPALGFLAKSTLSVATIMELLGRTEETTPRDAD